MVAGIPKSKMAKYFFDDVKLLDRADEVHPLSAFRTDQRVHLIIQSPDKKQYLLERIEREFSKFCVMS